MSTTGKRPLGLRILKFMLGTDQRSVAIAAAGLGVALGQIYAFNIIDLADRPQPPLWETFALGLGLSVFLLPGFFLSVSRMIPMVSPWEAVATMTAVALLPAFFQRIPSLGLTPSVTNYFLLFGGCIGFIAGTFLITRWILKRNRSSIP